MGNETILLEYRSLCDHCKLLLSKLSDFLPPTHRIVQELSLYVSNIEMHLSFTNIECVDVDMYDELTASFWKNTKGQSVKFYKQETFDSDKEIINDEASLRSLFKVSNCLPIFKNIPMQIASNAQKYMLNNTELSVTFLKTRDDIHILFSNVGPYCPEEDLEWVFENGYRGENTDVFIGLGVGLAIVKKIVELHSWLQMDCYVTSADQNIMCINGVEYSEFCFELVYAPIEKDKVDEISFKEDLLNMTQIVLVHNSYDIADKLIRVCRSLNGFREGVKHFSDKLRLELNLFLAKMRYCQFLIQKGNLSSLRGNKCDINIKKEITDAINNLKKFYYPNLKQPNITGKLKIIESYSCMYSIISRLLFIIFSCYNEFNDIDVICEDDEVIIDGFDVNFKERMSDEFQREEDLYRKLLNEMNYQILYNDQSVKIIF